MISDTPPYRIVKTVSNNIVRAKDAAGRDVFLTGKGIGFGKKTNDIVPASAVENKYVPESSSEKMLYEQLLKNTAPALVETASDIITYIQSQFEQPLNEHIHVALTDHIAFVVRRCKMGIRIDNPFYSETMSLYPRETEVAGNVLNMLRQKLHLNIADDEAGFIALHIISSLSSKTLSKIQLEASLLDKITEMLEKSFEIRISRSDLNYSRLVTHIRFLLERLEREESLSAPEELIRFVQTSYPQCYATAYKAVKMIQQSVQKSVPESEIFYLTLHVYRFSSGLSS